MLVVELAVHGSRARTGSRVGSPNGPAPGLGRRLGRPYRSREYHRASSTGLRLLTAPERRTAIQGRSLRDRPYTLAKSIDVGGANFIAGESLSNSRDIDLDRGLSSFATDTTRQLHRDIPGRGAGSIRNRWLNGLVGGGQFTVTTPAAGPVTPVLT